MRAGFFGPIGIYKPERDVDPDGIPILKASEYQRTINPIKPGSRNTIKVDKLQRRPNGDYIRDPVTGEPLKVIGVDGLPEQEEVGTMEPGYRILGPFGINVGTKEGRRRNTVNLSNALTPELTALVEARGARAKIDEAADLAPRIVTYAAAEAAVSTVASMAVPGLTGPIIAPAIAAHRLYKIGARRRKELQDFIYYDTRNNTPARRALLRGYNFLLTPGDIAFTGIYKGLNFLIDVFNGESFLTTAAEKMASRDKDLSGLKEVDGGAINKTLNVLDKVSDFLTFGTQVKPEPAKAA